MSVLTDNTAKLRKILEKVENLPEMPPSVAQATPTISVSSGGLITATATQAAGAVAAGTKTATRQLTTKGGTTITPGDAEQTAVSAGTYVTGDIKVAAAAGGAQVAYGTVTVGRNATSMAISPGFNPTYVMFSMAKNGSENNSIGYFLNGVAVRIVMKDGNTTVMYNANTSSGPPTLNQAAYSNGTVTYTFNQYGYTNRAWTIPEGTYEWVATT